MRRMATIVLTLVGSLILTSPASALTVEHNTFSDSFSFTSTGLCAFSVRLNITSTIKAATFYDDNGAVVRDISHVRQKTLFTNVRTGTHVKRIGVYTVTSLPNGSTVSGLGGRVLDADGDLLFTDAGRLVYNRSFDLVKFTPHVDAERFDSLLCAALS